MIYEKLHLQKKGDKCILWQFQESKRNIFPKKFRWNQLDFTLFRQW